MSVTVIKGVPVEIRDLGISFGAAEIVSGIDLHVREGEFVCLLGPSGCGKTTLLYALAGQFLSSVGIQP